MKPRRIFHSLAVMASLLPASAGYSRGGETGTLHEDEKPIGSSNNGSRVPVKNWAPYYLPSDHFRRMRARLSLQPLAPIPGWDSHHAFRHEDRYFSENGVYEILPVVPDSIR